MKRLFMLIILLISFFYSVLNVYAENVVVNNVSIREVGGIIYTEDPSVTNDLIQAKTVFKEINDSVTYQISLNFDNALYRIGSVIDSNQNDNISTNYSYQNDKLFMTLVYHDEIDSSLNLEDINVQVKLVDAYENPGTGNDYTMLYLCFMIMGILTFCIVYQKKKEIIIILLLFIPFVVYAKDDNILEFTFSGSQIGVGCDVSFGDSMDSTVCVYGQECEVPSITYTMDNQFLIGWSTTDGGGLIYEAEEFSLDKAITTSGNITLYPVWSNKAVSFDYTGSGEVYTIHRTGAYKLEVWGAEGGNAHYVDSSRDCTWYGGKGGYSSGIISLDSGTILYTYVGGAGAPASRTGALGGFNGGGSGGANSDYTYLGGGGGGASDIRIGEDSLYARVIVAGGGGGGGYGTEYSAYEISGGAGGGVNGQSAPTYFLGYESRIGLGASQTSGGAGGTQGSTLSGSAGSFGGGATGASGKAGGAGGGGGWYGGGSGANGYPCSGSGGGGSGYVYTESTASNYPSGSLLNSSYYLNEAETIAGNQIFASPSGETETGHSGNGYARITYLG